jgi:putative flippase GtrA
MNGEIVRFVRFLAVGVLNTGFGYGCYSVLVLIGLPLWLCVAGSTVLAIFFNFASYGRIVFDSSSGRALPRFLLGYGLIGLLNYLLLAGLGALGLGPLPAQALLLPVLAVAGYTTMRFFVFRRG